MRYRFLSAASVATIVLLAAIPGAHAQVSERDPYENFNRRIFGFNQAVDKYALKPAAQGYRFIFPELVRDGIENVLNNARTPGILANDLLQGEVMRAEKTFGRFMLNTIVGLGGILDVATWAGMEEHHSEDFGQTLAVYGVDSGPYVMLPVLGPSNPRDVGGFVVDIFLDPISLFAPTTASISRTAVEGIDLREENIETVEELERTSLDFYAATRTLSRQLRENEIRNGRPAELDDIYDDSLYEDFEDPFADPAGDDPFADPAEEPAQ